MCLERYIQLLSSSTMYNNTVQLLYFLFIFPLFCISWSFRGTFVLMKNKLIKKFRFYLNKNIINNNNNNKNNKSFVINNHNNVISMQPHSKGALDRGWPLFVRCCQFTTGYQVYDHSYIFGRMYGQLSM